jgi:hypothetical protein
METQMYEKVIDAAQGAFSRISRGRTRIKGTAERNKYVSLSQLIADHFKYYSEEAHPCRETLSLALEKLENRAATIIETGSAAWGTNSSLLFDSYVNSFGGKFHSVDIRIQPSVSLRSLCSEQSTFFCDESLSFLKEYARLNNQIDLLYLDSWDVNWKDPLPSALHGFQEFMSMFPMLKANKGSLLLVDDTPSDRLVMSRVQPQHVDDFEKFKGLYGLYPGKGALIKQFLVCNQIGKEIKHNYQLLWEF